MTSRVSAGILLFRVRAGHLEVLLAHMGGPLHRARDLGSWTIPKGEIEGDEDLLAVARREFAEETGHILGDVTFLALGSIVQKGGKVVHAWAAEGDLDPATATSNTFRMEWPPGSGREETFPEIDRVVWFGADEARLRIRAAQVPLIDQLEAHLGLT